VLNFIIIAPEFERAFGKANCRFWFVLHYTHKWLSCLDIHLHQQISQISSVPYVRKCRDRNVPWPKRPDRNGQTESARPKRLRPKWLRTNRTDRNGSERIGHSEKSCTLPDISEMRWRKRKRKKGLSKKKTLPKSVTRTGAVHLKDKRLVFIVEFVFSTTFTANDIVSDRTVKLQKYHSSCCENTLTL